MCGSLSTFTPPFHFNFLSPVSSFTSYLLTGYEPNVYDLTETYVESYTESQTNPPFAKVERTGRLVGERKGRPVGPIGQELNVGNAQIRTLWDRQREQFLGEGQTEIDKHEVQADSNRQVYGK